ncbi:MAG: glycerol kinase GlpK [Planctomycetales bacterium]
MTQYVMALDQGTTSSRALIFDDQANVVGSAQREFEQIYPASGEVEHDPEAIWNSQLSVAREALAASGLSADQLTALGVTNQRETTILWERDTGRPVANAIVWQSRVSADVCRRLKAEGTEPIFREKTGLLLDPYFSGTKITHLLESVPGLRERAEKGEILFGTVDSFLIWRLTGGAKHVTDHGNASRTLMFNIHDLTWDDELLKLLGVPRAMLPEPRPSSEVLGETVPELLGASVPIAGCAGDQQAATFGQACFQPGMIKNTYGTGCFMLLNIGTKPVASENQLLTTIGWTIGNETTYCLEGSVFVAGAAVQWLRDGLRIIQTSQEVEQLAAAAADSGGVVMVPAFVGLGAPYWDPNARGAIFGITRDTRAEHIARAAVESMAHQTRDVLEAMRKDAETPLTALRADGGAAVNDDLLQFQADLLGIPVQRPAMFESTALGAASLAGLATGVWNDQAELTANWSLQREFSPSMESSHRDRLVHRWNKAVSRVLDWEEPESS